MTSFISALSLIVLALVSICFTLPITENPLSETSSPFYNDITTDKPLGERMVFNDVTISSTSAGIERSSDESIGFETSSIFEDATREPRVFVDESTVVSATFVPTTERSFHQQREMKDSSVVTVEPTTEHAEFIPRDFGTDSQNETEVTTESSPSKREFDDSDLTTLNSVTGVRSSEQLFTTIEPETSSTDMETDYTTNVMSSFTSTSSAVAPELYTHELSTTRKYTGLLTDKEDQEEEKEHNDEEHNDEEHKKPHGKHDKDDFEVEEHKESHEKHEKAHGKHKKPHEKHESGSEEHKHDDKVKKDKKHKKVHDKDELEIEESKKESEKESSEEKKVSGKHEKVEHSQEGDKDVEEEKKVSGKHEKVEHSQEEDKDVEEEKKVSGKHRKEQTETEEHKQEGDKDVEEEKKVSEKHGKGQTETEEHKQEGDKEVEEGRQPEKHDEDNFEKNVEATEPTYLIKTRPVTFRKAKIESDDGIQYPKAVYDQDAWKKIPNVPSDFAVLDESNDVVTTFSKLNPLYTEESKLNQGEEPSRAE